MKNVSRVILLIMLLSICLNITALAMPELPDPDQFIALGQAMHGKEDIKAQADQIAIAFIPILQTIGNLLIILAIGIMGIQWLYADPRKRAQLKENMVSYVIGVAVVFCGVNITALVTDYFETEFKVGEYKGKLVVFDHTPPPTTSSYGGTTTGPSSGGASSPVINFIASYEGYAAYGYRGIDFWNVTIGYGHVVRPGEHFNEPLTEAQAKALLESDMREYVDGVKNCTAGLNLTQQQFDSLVSFAYNCGVGALQGSTLLKDIRAGASLDKIKIDFLAWSKCAGVTIEGLYKRRMDEFMMFATGKYTRTE